MIVLVTTQMRVGSTWLCRLLCDLLDAPKWTFVKSVKEIKPYVIKFRKTNHVIKMHQSHPKEVISIADKTISITRDVRDIIVSRAFFKNRKKGKKDPKSNGKRIVNSFCDKQVKWVVDCWKCYNDGYEHPNYLLLEYKNLKFDTKNELKKICNFLGIKRTNEQLNKVIRNNSFKKLSGGRQLGNEDGMSFHRKGIVGDWKNYLSKENLDKIKNLLNS